jgi:hypothetical protein
MNPLASVPEANFLWSPIDRKEEYAIISFIRSKEHKNASKNSPVHWPPLYCGSIRV